MNTSLQRLRAIVFIALSLLSLSTVLAAGPTKLLPPQLQPWVDWVLEKSPEQGCPFVHSGESRLCGWPSDLDIRLSAQGGEFKQRWHLYGEGWVTLPGGEGQWPQQVSVDDKPSPVVANEGEPSIYLKPGEHRIAGNFTWTELPEALPIPRTTGLIRLQLDSKPVPFPYIDPTSGQLWIQKGEQAKEATEEDRLQLQVLRRLTDDLPMNVDTRLHLQVSGAQREALLEYPLLKGSIPLALTSPLPARLEPDGKLRVQVRPGQWTIEVRARFPAELVDVTAPPASQEWPSGEIWAFQARNDLRLVEVGGVAPVDPRQTNLPTEWQSLPAYRLNPGEALTFKVLRRGDPQPEPNRLTIERQAWLDFNGEGYTVRDKIGGLLTSGWRLDAQPELKLGRVALDGKPQFITRNDKSGPEGVEVRRGALDLVADSRWEGDIASLAAVGWREDFSKAGINLYLPPGWRIFSVSGVDNVPDTWLQNWTLLDIFLVLIVTIAVGRLWSWPWAAMALFTLAILWHEPEAPRFVWLNLVAAAALLRVTAEAGRLQNAVRLYRLLGVAALVLISLPFVVQQVRVGLYPQLERPWESAEGSGNALVENTVASLTPMAPSPKRKYAPAQMEAPAPAPMAEMAREADEKASKGRFDFYTSLPPPPAPPLVEIDPNAVIQTGPGVPDWRWNSVRLEWNGPVQQGQKIGIFYLSPWQNLALNILRIACLLLLAWRLLGKIPVAEWLPRTAAPAAMALLLVAVGLGHSSSAVAQEIPSPELLEELKTRLLSPPRCSPACAGISRGELEASASHLQLRLQVSAQERVAVPLPGNSQHWLPTEMAVDGQPAILYRQEDGSLWTLLEAGVHQVTLQGELPDKNSVQIALPLLPQRMEAKANGWVVDGIGEKQLPSGQLQLTRVRTETPADGKAAELEPSELPPFVMLERRLTLGLDWTISTRITRLSPTGTAAVLKVPLLPGESITSQGIKVENNQAMVQLDAADQEFQWGSVLKKGDIQLTVSQQTQWIESWIVDVMPIWHLEAAGIPVIHHTNTDGRWQPQWRPWPGESVQLHLSRPEGIKGNTLTIQSAALSLVPGQRAMDATLRLGLESSQGGRHAMQLPAEAKLQSVSIDGQAQPIRQQDRAVDLPLKPGSQTIELNWRTNEVLPILFKTPEIDLGAPAVNASLTATLGADRWVLLVGGPRMGPAVLFWGVVVAVAIASLLLAKLPGSPLRHYQWFLLGLGLTQSDLMVPIIVIGWLLALSYRERSGPGKDATQFNVIQALLALWTLAALLVLFASVQQGLLGQPEMQVLGNQSTAQQLQWYQDRTGQGYPQAWVFSLPILAYRLAMLAWAMWLAFSLLKWLRWGWQGFSSGGLWMKVEKRPKLKP